MENQKKQKKKSEKRTKVIDDDDGFRNREKVGIKAMSEMEKKVGEGDEWRTKECCMALLADNDCNGEEGEKGVMKSIR